jgi:hypothetical protein
MALPVDGTNPCSVLNNLTVGTPVTTELYPVLTSSGNPSSANVNWAAFAADGVLKEFDATVSALNTGTLLPSQVLQAQNASSSFRLIKFLSGSGAANTDPENNYASLKDTLLYTGTTTRTYKGIVGRFAAKLGSTPYTYPQTLDANGKPVPLLTDAIVTSIITELMTDGLLMKQSDIYAVDTTGKMTSGSLFYFYDLTQKGTISQDQVKARTKLEARNLRFYGAFFVEYCYYKCRYEVLLSEYFKVYQQTTTGASATYTKKDSSSPQAPLFAASGAATAPSATVLADNQTQYLSILAYHLACVNTRLTDMTRLLDKINDYYSGVFTNLQTALNANADTTASTASVAAAVVALQTSSTKANEYLKDEDFRKGVMEYTSEKNRYANILLGFYAFLNLSALAVIVYSM